MRAVKIQTLICMIINQTDKIIKKEKGPLIERLNNKKKLDLVKFKVIKDKEMIL